ncbi:hypothetical protein [Actinoplanes regularis]|uniref:Uncharacterized protein n=1 Tax=Actinoplanes regularis TaxID=52697 RepID=A0A238Y5G1_9ACTN|nr:hypothetical protein [Actinoplanes regularis]GIE86186.1 hypothetical protein Are01nite_26660 [Actinoplanes regularis]SNR66212.1 hypothetical protein SAMN06264365_104266 [Actinoplanes regularis]
MPDLRRLPPGQTAVPFAVSERHTGFDTLDVVTQQGTSHHYSRSPDGRVRYNYSNFRFLWPSECDLMGRLAGLILRQRTADWKGSPFTAESTDHVSIWRK